MKRDCKQDFDEVSALVGDGDRRLGKRRIAALCGFVKRGAISNWRVHGIPRAHRATIHAHLRNKEGTTPPAWLLDLAVPKTGEEIDKLISREQVLA